MSGDAGELDAAFRAPGFMGERPTLAVLVGRIGSSSLALDIHASRGGQPILDTALTVVATSLVEHRPIPLPDDLRAAVERYQENTR